jgi:hypothetical protein
VPPINDSDAERLIYYSLTNWIYTTVSKGVFDLIYKPNVSAFTIWTDIEGLFRDNKMQHAVLLEAEYRSEVQGDLSISDHCTKLKKLADNLHNINHLISSVARC